MILLEITRTPGGIAFSDTEDFMWQDTGDFIWGDLDRISDEDYSGTNPWMGLVIDLSPIQFAPDVQWGGYVKTRFGSVDISLDFFDQSEFWEPPDNMGMSLYYTDTDDDSKVLLVDGTLHNAVIKDDRVTYDIYSGAVDEVKLLDTTTDYNGNTVAKPRAFGVITNKEEALRGPDVDGKQTFWSGYIDSPTFYDGGVSVPITRVSAGDYWWKMNNTPVDSITVTGTGEYSTVDDIAEWVSGRIGVSCDASLATSPSPSVIRYVSQQRMATEFLGDVCKWTKQLFYVSNSVLYLVAMDSDNGSQTLDPDSDPFNFDLIKDPPIALITAAWQLKESGQFRNAGGTAIAQYVRVTDQSESVESLYPYGSEQSVTPFDTDRANINTELTEMLAYAHKSRGRLQIPLKTIPYPGKKFTLTTPELTKNGELLSVVFRARNIQFDVNNYLITIEGDRVTS